MDGWTDKLAWSLANTLAKHHTHRGSRPSSAWWPGCPGGRAPACVLGPSEQYEKVSPRLPACPGCPGCRHTWQGCRWRPGSPGRPSLADFPKLLRQRGASSPPHPAFLGILHCSRGVQCGRMPASALVRHDMEQGYTLGTSAAPSLRGRTIVTLDKWRC
jgi:hypothetical protein